MSVKRFTFDLSETVGIKAETYPIINDIDVGSIAERGGLKAGSLILSLNGKKYDKKEDFLNKIKSLKQSSPIIELVVLEEPQNYNFSSLRFAKVILSPPTNIVEVNTHDQIETISVWHDGENTGEDGDTFTMNPITKGFSGMRGEVIFIPKGYKFYHGFSSLDERSFKLENNRGLYVSDRKSALIYSESLIRLKTKKPLVLFNILDPQNIESILDKSDRVFNESDKKLFKQVVDKCIRSSSNLSHSIYGYVDELEDFVKIGLDTFKYNSVNYGSNGEIHRVSNGLFDMALPSIPIFVKSNINGIFDGYYGGYTPSKTGFFHPEVFLLNQYECLELVEERAEVTSAAKKDEWEEWGDVDSFGGAVRKKVLTHYHDNVGTLLTKLRKKKLSRTKRKRKKNSKKKNSKKKSKARRKKKSTKRCSYF